MAGCDFVRKDFFMNQKEPIDTEKFVSWKQCEEIFEQYLFSLSGMDYNNGCYRFTVKTTVKRKDALNHDELVELCTRLCAVCIDVRLEGEKDYCWTVFYTTVT